MNYVMMITFNVFLFAVIFALVYKLLTKNKKFLATEVAIAALLIGFFIGLITDLIVSSNADTISAQVYSRELKSVEDINNPNASFILGLGDNDTNYYYMIKGDADNWKMSSMKASMVTIVHVDKDAQPKIVKEKDIIANREIREKTILGSADNYKYTMYLPEGFVTIDYPIVVTQ